MPWKILRPYWRTCQENDGYNLAAFHRELKCEPVGDFKENIVKTTSGHQCTGDQGQAFCHPHRQVFDGLLESLQRRFPNVELLITMQIFA